MAKDLGIGSPKKSNRSQNTPQKSVNTEKQESGALVDLNFKVSSEFKREFKIWAASHDLTQKRALELAFDSLKENTN